MPKKVKPSEQISSEINKLLSPSRSELFDDCSNLLGRLIQLNFKKILQEALEQEVEQYLGRSWGSRETGQRVGYRNGYEPKKFVTAEGVIAVEAPQVRGSGETYQSDILANLPRVSGQLEKMALESYVRGLSTRDIEETFKDEEGNRLLKKDQVTALSEKLNEEYNQFRNRDLSELDTVYLFVDAVYESLNRKAKSKQAVFVAWGILADGTKQLISMASGNRESTEQWREFFHDMIKRNMRRPLLVVSDGAAGLIRAVDEVFYRSRRQRCIAHKLRNIISKLPRKGVDEVKSAFKAIYYASCREAADWQVEKVVNAYADEYPAAVQCMLDDLEACLTIYEFPEAHRRFIRTTNLLERTFVEQRRRTKIIPQFLNETSCMKLVFATLIRVSEKWKRIKMTNLERTVLKNIRKLMSGTEQESEFLSFEFEIAA